MWRLEFRGVVLAALMEVIVHAPTNLWLKTSKFVGSPEKAIVSEKLPSSENKSCSS